MVLRERSCHKENTCEIWKPYLLVMANTWVFLDNRFFRPILLLAYFLFWNCSPVYCLLRERCWQLFSYFEFTETFICNRLAMYYSLACNLMRPSSTKVSLSHGCLLLSCLVPSLSKLLVRLYCENMSWYKQCARKTAYHLSATEVSPVKYFIILQAGLNSRQKEWDCVRFQCLGHIGDNNCSVILV